MDHPYKVYKIVPESIPCKGVAYPIDEQRLIEAHERYLKAVSTRNKPYLKGLSNAI